MGSVAEEAAKLLGALQDWAVESGFTQGERLDQPVGRGAVDDHIGHGQDCAYCPLCRAINFARGTIPQAREHLAVAIGALAQAATAALRASAGEAEAGEQHSDRARGPTRVDLDE